MTGVESLPPRPRVVVAGVGNVLCADDGVGVRVVEELQKHYRFPPQVAIVGGGCLGLQLLDAFVEAEAIIVVDAVQSGAAAGTLHRLVERDVAGRLRRGLSMHEVTLFDTFWTLGLLRPTQVETVVVGVEAGDVSPWSMAMTSAVRDRIPALVQGVLGELDRLGVRYERAAR